MEMVRYILHVLRMEMVRYILHVLRMEMVRYILHVVRMEMVRYILHVYITCIAYGNGKSINLAVDRGSVFK